MAASRQRWQAPRFEPLFRNPHWQTLASHLWPRKFDTRRFPVEERIYPTEPGIQVLVKHQRPEGVARGQLVLVHGMESSAEAGYMRSLAQAALIRQFRVARFQLRSCGGTEHLSETFYHAGLTVDLRTVLEAVREEIGQPAWLVGFSLGANMVLKLAGELGDSASRWIAGACAISTPIDLLACASRLGEPRNSFYERRFLRRMRRRLEALRHQSADASRQIGSVRELDDTYTAPSFGFSSAEHYYATQSSRNFFSQIRVPTLLLQAKDDSLIPFEAFSDPAIQANPHISLAATDHGGHVAFLARGSNRFWIDQAVLEWIEWQIAQRQT